MSESRGILSPDENSVRWPWYLFAVVVLLLVIVLVDVRVGDVPGNSDDTLMYHGVLYGNCSTHDSSVPRYLQCDRIGVLPVPGVTESTVLHNGIVYGECVGNNAIIELPAGSVRCYPVAVS